MQMRVIVVISSESVNFFKYDAKLIIECLLGYDSYDLTGKSISKQIEELITLYNHKFSNVNPYERSLGANFKRTAIFWWYIMEYPMC